MSVIAYIFPEIPAPKNMVTEMPKKPCFRGPLDRKHGKSVKTMFQSDDTTFTKFISQLEGSCITKSLF